MTRVGAEVLKRFRSGPRAVEIGLTVVVAVGASLGVWSELANSPNPYPAALGAYALGIAASVVLLQRQRRPVAVSIAAMIFVLIYHLAGYPGEAPGLVFFFAFYSVAAYGRGSRSLFVGLLLAVLASVIPILPPHAQEWTSFSVLGPTVGFAWMVVVGEAARQRRLAADSRVEEAAAAAEARIRTGMADERLRIARDLHDVLAHTLSAISVQSGVAVDSLPDRPDEAKTAMVTVRALAKEALPELRATLGTLRGVGDDPQTMSPQPRLAELDGVAETARQSGLVVNLTLAPSSAELAPFLELTIYRIVQEGITNVVRHAHARSVSVDVRVSDGSVLIDIVDDGPAVVGPVKEGLGILGMRERAQLVGGSLTAHKRAHGGFQIHAELPVEPS